MMFIYPIVRIQFSFVQFSLLCYEFCILSKIECKYIYYHYWRDHESSSFRKLARNKWICPEICDFFSWSIYFISHQLKDQESLKWLKKLFLEFLNFHTSGQFKCTFHNLLRLSRLLKACCLVWLNQYLVIAPIRPNFIWEYIQKITMRKTLQKLLYLKKTSPSRRLPAQSWQWKH